MANHLKSYKAVIFDCDGVILDSNKLKSEAFFLSALKFGEEEALELKNYHISHGGISRQEKFKFFLTNIYASKNYNEDYHFLLAEYAAQVKSGLLECVVNENLFNLNELLANHDKLVISGGSEEELNDVFMKRELHHFFNKGIYGNPRSKKDIFYILMQQGLIETPAIYIGDSKYDWEVATTFGIDFLFYSPWTEFLNWKEFCIFNNIDYFHDFEQLKNFIIMPN